MATSPPHYQPAPGQPMGHYQPDQSMGGPPMGHYQPDQSMGGPPMGHYQPAQGMGGHPMGHPCVSPVSVPLMPQPVGPKPTATTCRNCHSQVVTRTVAAASTKTHLMALFCCLLGCWLCCCIPYCVDSCQNIEHYCPSCNAFVGTYTN